MIKLLPLLFLFLLEISSALSAVPQRLQLEVGDVQSITIDPGWSLRLSQKNILNVEEQGKGKFQMIALRSGLVYVRALDSQGLPQQSWIVAVESRQADGKADILRHPRWRPLLCMEPGIRCDAETSTIVGHSESLIWLHKARELCDKHPPCRFQAILSPNAQTHWAAKLSTELNTPKVSVDADGFVKVDSSCQNQESKREEQWRKWIQERFGAPLQVRCSVFGEGRYRLDIVALAHKRSDSDLSNPLQWGTIHLLPQENIEVFLQGLSSRHDTKILARPEVLLNLGGSLEITDGMDIATLAPQRDQTLEIWKAVGFSLQMKLLEQHDGEVKMSVNLQLSRPQEGQRALDRSSLQTEVWLGLDQLKLVGHIQARTVGFEESRVPWLGAIPFIGGLFRWQVDSSAESQVYLLIRLRKQDLELPSPEQWQEAAPIGAAKDLSQR